MKRVLPVFSAGIAVVAVLVALQLKTNIAGEAKATSGAYNPTAVAIQHISEMNVGKYDWPQWGGTPLRNNTPEGKDIPTEWDIEAGTNIKWKAKLGTQTYGNPVVANGRVYVGTNNGAGYIKRYPWTQDVQVDLGCLICFDEQTGEMKWQHSSPKLAVGRVNDWPLQGICCAPYVDGERLWFVSSRGEVLCLDTEGFYDEENDGPFKTEDNNNKTEADVIWRFDMMGALGVSQHNMCSCSVTCVGDILLVNTSNGVDESHINIPAPNAPSFFAMNRDTGKVLWTDKSPDIRILHGQWSSPTYAELGGRKQALFAGGDGWLYSFDPAGDGKGNPKLHWKFDCNPKDSMWILGGRGTRNNIIATPVVYDGLVYVTVGQDPEHGEGPGNLWCIDPTGNGDVSPTLAIGPDGKVMTNTPRLQTVNPENNETIKPNANSKVVWHYDWHDADGDGKRKFEEEIHRSCGTVAIKDDILYIADFSGLFHCLEAKKHNNGKAIVHWTYDMFAAAWGSPLIVDGKVYIGDEDGDVAIFELSRKMKLINEVNMGNAVYSTPIVANNTLFISNKNELFAISPEGK